MTKPFPGAPACAEYTEEGWMIWGDEAWQLHEWSLLTPMQRRGIVGDQPTVDETSEEARKRQHRLAGARRRQRAKEAR